MSGVSECSASATGTEVEHGGEGADGRGVCVSIKLFLRDKILRFQAARMDEIRRKVQQTLTLRHGRGVSQDAHDLDPDAFELAYLDTEDDEITLTDDADLQEAVQVVRAGGACGKPLKVQVKMKA